MPPFQPVWLPYKFDPARDPDNFEDWFERYFQNDEYAPIDERVASRMMNVDV